MFASEEIPKLTPDRKNGKAVGDFGKERKAENARGRKVILAIFFLTILFSVIFWIKGNFQDWLAELFGPSSWTFTD